ncbi:MAG: endolytic transglycosylase MltG, partial [Xanthomonadales bacterium]|nr:endolytic transglycosylase MltG [Xanthomonadales bacterium]
MKREHGGVLIRLLLGLIVFALLASAGIVWRDFSRFSNAALAVPADGTSVVVKRGASFRQIMHGLREHKLSAAPRLYWRALAWRMDVTDALHAGEYAITPGTTPRQLLGEMAAGQVLQHRFTIVEGWRFEEALAALRADKRLRHPSKGLSDAEVMQRLGAAGVNPEGRFLPETYAFVRGDSDLDILKRAHLAMGNLLESAWPKRDPDLPLDSPYQALILASIVEKETAQASERKRIAGVFERRLKIGMLLQTDPTVIYGMGDKYHGNIRRKDLTTDTPYNTYTRAGLPPTP